jgi:hypothetical protein
VCHLAWLTLTDRTTALNWTCGIQLIFCLALLAYLES